MKLYPFGPNYAEIQKQANYRHSNGQIETEGDAEAADKLAERLAGYLHTPPKYILVLGCRTGYETEALADCFDALVVGVDIVEEFVSHAVKRTPAMVADMHNLTAFPVNSFDLTVAVGTLEHCYDPDKAVAEIARVTRHSAYITADLEQDRGSYASHYAFSADQQEWLDLFTKHGFTVVNSRLEKGTEAYGIHAFLEK